MKSLDIVNRNIEEAQEALDEATDDFRIYPCDYGTWEEIEEHYTAPYLRHYIEENKQIKQDLEVLEIIKNKNVDIGRFKARCYISSNPHHLMRTYNCGCNYIDDELSIDEVIKLKQRLEVNE